MSNLKSKPFLVLAFTVIAVAMSGCGKSKNDVGNTLPQYTPQACQPGIPCAPGYTGGPAGTFGGSMNAITGPLTFGGTMYIDSANIYGGTQYPQAPFQTNMVPVGQQMVGTSPYGTMTIQTVQQVGPNLYNVTGAIQLDPQYAQSLAMSMGGYGAAGQVVAINVGHYNTSLYGGGFGGGVAAMIRLQNGAQIPFYL